jgi:hypothetical protein
MRDKLRSKREATQDDDPPYVSIVCHLDRPQHLVLTVFPKDEPIRNFNAVNGSPPSIVLSSGPISETPTVDHHPTTAAR